MENKEIKIDKYIESGAFYKAVVEDGTDIIFIVDYNGIIKYHNPSVELTLGHKPKSLINKDFFEFIHPAVKKDFHNNFKKSTKKPFDYNVEFMFLCKNGSYKYLEFNSINLCDKNNVKGLILDCRDVTQRIEDAEELLKAQKAKQQFLANMSHEIRTPINGISGMATLLAVSDKKEDRKKYIDAIKNSAESLKVIINDILDFSMIESGKLKFEKIGFYVKKQFDTLYNTFIHQANEKDLELNLKVEPEADILLEGDPVRVNQILINLISNSLKFTDKGKIEVTVRLDSKKGNVIWLNFDVTDTGIGIPKKKLNSIFESFTQADASVSRRYGGTGLGLSITKQLIDLMGGEINVKSVENEGTTFTFTIPFKQGSEENNEASLDQVWLETSSLKGFRVLVVEDNEVNRLYASRLLEIWKCDVMEADNGNTAIEILKKNNFDLILMDLQMPIMDGFEATTIIRNKFPKPKSDVPIVALTANAIKGDSDRCFQVGMNDYLIKPFKPEELEQTLTKYNTKNKKQPHKDGINENLQEYDTILPDLDQIKLTCHNDVKFMKEIVGIFISSTPKHIQELKESIDEQDFQKIRKDAHRLKSSIAFMGLKRATTIIKRIEELGSKEKGMKEIKSNFDEFSTIAEKAVNFLQKEISKL